MRGQFSAADHERITAAIRTAETRTSGEIYCVLAHDSDSYFYPAAFMLSAALMAASLAAAALLEWQWHALAVWHFVAVQSLAFLAAIGLVAALPALRLLLVPRSLVERRAHQNAVKQFLAHNIHRTDARTGVLIFVSVAERHAEIVADTGIDARVGRAGWQEIVDRLTASASVDRLADGFVEAVAAVGALLAAHFPVGADDRNELDDHVVEI